MLAENVYQKENYEVVDFDNDSKICMVFCSGHGLYGKKPVTEEIFSDVLLNKNRYEWKRTAYSKKLKKYVKRVIFVRDIYTQWYITGLSAQNPTIDCVIKLIDNLSSGYEVITVGNSAGGYLAAILAEKLEAKSCFNFSGQFQLWCEWEYTPFIRDYFEDRDREKYYDITNLHGRCNSNTIIYYFYADKCKADVYQASLVEKKHNVKLFAFDEIYHGSSMYPINIPYILVSDEDKLENLYRKYESKSIGSLSFLFSSLGFRIALYEIVKYFFVHSIIRCKKIFKSVIQYMSVEKG